MTYVTPAREYTPGMGQAVADRTINRKTMREVSPYIKTIHLPRQDDTALDDQVAQWCKSNGYAHDGYLVTHGDGEDVEIELTVTGELQVERWADVAHRVALGNSLLHPVAKAAASVVGAIAARGREFDRLHHHLRQATLLMSGRHLQHGDETQPTRPQEVFTNCSTAAASFLSFYLLLNGSGVGRCYDDDMMAVDYNQLPITVCVCDGDHADVQAGLFTVLDLKGALHLYGHGGRQVEIFEVPDSREGWAKAVEKMELMAYMGEHRDTVLLLDFSKVRPKGSPIKGMQDRPASGPGPLISAINNVAKLREAGMEPWRAALYADHYLAECVLVGGARRAARMATKSWRDKNVLGFVAVKRGGFLWSANNSVTVDEEFWAAVKKAMGYIDAGWTEEILLGSDELDRIERHAFRVFMAVCRAAYYDGTGEPGFINVDRLTYKDEGTEGLFDGDFARSARYQVEVDTRDLMQALVNRWMAKDYKVIVNPCGEIVLIMLGGYCVIADTVPFHAGSVKSDDKWLGGTHKEWDDDAEDAMRVATRALMRTNLMDSLYGKEVKRTNRIGVGMTGIHEYAFARFGYGWKDLVDEDKSKPFWLMLSRFKRAVKDEARKYAAELGVAVPHTDTTLKPAGTTSKLFGLTEGAHLPTMREFVRWVQFRNGDPLIEEYRAKGYPVRELRIYHGTTIVGFPTKPTICELGMGDKLVTAAEATPEEQYQWLRLLEKYWITGVEEDGVTPLAESGNQVSYTLKYDPAKVSFEEFTRTLLEGQSTIRCCSVMPQTDTSAYEYLPEQPVSKHEYEAIAAAIDSADTMKEDVGFEHVDCAGGACPISFGENEASQ